MTDQPDEGRDHKVDQATMTTGILKGVRQIEGLEGNLSPAFEDSPSEPPYVKEPLFSKKVLIGWATAAFVVWFAFSFIVPEIIREVKSAVVDAMEEPGSNTATKTVIRTRNGMTITRTETGISIERKGSAPAAATTPTAPIAAPPPDPAGTPPAAATPPDPTKKAAGETTPRR